MYILGKNKIMSVKFGDTQSDDIKMTVNELNNPYVYSITAIINIVKSCMKQWKLPKVTNNVCGRRDWRHPLLCKRSQ